jgi:hypothetical protein
MYTPYWSYDQSDAVMNQIELGFDGTTDESSTIMHRMIKAFGGTYDISHNYWSRNG